MALGCDRHDLVGGERLSTFAGFLQNRDQLVLRWIVERILQPLLNFTTALRRMFDIPMRGLRDRLNRWNQIAVAELRLDLKEIHYAMVHAAVKRKRTRCRTEGIRNADHFKLMVELSADDLAHLS